MEEAIVALLLLLLIEDWWVSRSECERVLKEEGRERGEGVSECERELWVWGIIMGEYV